MRSADSTVRMNLQTKKNTDYPIMGYPSCWNALSPNKPVCQKTDDFFTIFVDGPFVANKRDGVELTTTSPIYAGTRLNMLAMSY